MYQQQPAYSNKRDDPSSPELPAEILHTIFEIEKQFTLSGIPKKIAVFDLDNTLLLGDIGEAVYAALKLQGHLPGLAWEKYRRLLNASKAEAYCSVVTAMSGLPERTVHKVTLEVLSRKDAYLELEKSFIAVPRPHPVMARLVTYLRLIGYQVHVISASNEISARLAAWRFFEIPPFNVFGIRQRIDRGRLSGELFEPIPIGEGKVAAYRRFIGSIDPIIAGGDSPLDVPMLQMTDPRGFALWVGEEKVGYEIVQQKIGKNLKVHFLQRPVDSQLDEESSND